VEGEMNLKSEEELVLKELCTKNNVSYEKILELIEKSKEYEFMKRRVGIKEDLKSIIREER
jgi:hypothetical protein